MCGKKMLETCCIISFVESFNSQAWVIMSYVALHIASLSGILLKCMHLQPGRELDNINIYFMMYAACLYICRMYWRRRSRGLDG